MSVDKLVDSTQLDADLTSVANAIRTKGGTSAQLAFPAEFVSAIEDIETGGGTPNNISVKLQNSSESSGSIAANHIQYNSALGVIVPAGTNGGTMSAGSSSSRSMLRQGSYIGFIVNVALTSVTYNGTAVAYQQSGSGNNRYIKIELPDNYDNTIPIVIKR